MKKGIIILLLLTLLFPVFSISLAEQTFDESWLWFLNGGTAPETVGSGVLLWYVGQNSSAYRQDLVPEAYRPEDGNDVGYVIVVRQGDTSLYGFYSNGASGLIRSVDLFLTDAATGVTVGQEHVSGGNPPQKTTSTAMQIYGNWPNDSDVAAAAERLCQAIPAEKKTASLWRYVIREAEDEREIRGEYMNTSPRAMAYLVFEPGIEIQGYNGYVGGVLEIPAEIDGLPVTAIGSGAFVNMRGFDAITVPDTVTRIGENAFGSAYTSVLLPESLTLLPYQALADASIQRIPSGMKAIGESALSSNWNLEYLDLPEGLEYIGGFAFSNCMLLQTVTLPRSLTYVDPTAFMDCGNLTLRVYRDSYAHILLNDSGKAALEIYAQEHGTGIENLEWITIPEYEVID